MVQIHPTCVPVKGDFQSKLTLMSESLRNDGRIWVPKKLEDAKALQAGTKKGKDIPEADRDYYLERRYPAFGNLVPRDVASRAAKERCDAGFGVNSTGLAVFLDFSDAINRLGKEVVKQKYGNPVSYTHLVPVPRGFQKSPHVPASSAISGSENNRQWQQQHPIR